MSLARLVSTGGAAVAADIVSGDDASGAEACAVSRSAEVSRRVAGSGSAGLVSTAALLTEPVSVGWFGAYACAVAVSAGSEAARTVVLWRTGFLGAEAVFFGAGACSMADTG